MGFKTGNFPDVDPGNLPRQAVPRPHADHVHPLGRVRLRDPEDGAHHLHHEAAGPLPLGGLSDRDVHLRPRRSSTSGAWWNEPIVYQKLILWTMLLEALGLAGSWGPLAGHFKPMTGGILYWLRPGTDPAATVAGEGAAAPSGDTRTVVRRPDLRRPAGHVVVAAGASRRRTTRRSTRRSPTTSGLVRPTVLILLIALLVLIGLRDKVVFLAARSEQYLPGDLLLRGPPFVDMIIALQAADRHRSGSAPASPSSATTSRWWSRRWCATRPWMPFKKIKRAHYRNFPEDLRPSRSSPAVSPTSPARSWRSSPRWCCCSPRTAR